MKNKLCIFASIIFIISTFVGCSANIKASDKAISVGKQAIAVADDYLDGSLTYNAASDKLDDLKEQMKYVDDLKQGDENKAADFSVSSGITILSSAIFSDSIGSSDDTYNKIVEARNSLAEKIGEKKR